MGRPDRFLVSADARRACRRTCDVPRRTSTGSCMTDSLPCWIRRDSQLSLPKGRPNNTFSYQGGTKKGSVNDIKVCLAVIAWWRSVLAFLVLVMCYGKSHALTSNHKFFTSLFADASNKPVKILTGALCRWTKNCFLLKEILTILDLKFRLQKPIKTEKLIIFSWQHTSLDEFIMLKLPITIKHNFVCIIIK